MRYVGLVFLGMVLWGGQASAEMLDAEEAEEVLTQGKTVSEFYEGTKYAGQRWTRVIYRNDLYICQDLKAGGQVQIVCWDDRIPNSD